LVVLKILLPLGRMSQRTSKGANSSLNSDGGQSKDDRIKSYWFSKNPSKNWGEKFFLWYSPVWISFFGLVVVTETYHAFRNWEYTLLGFAVSFPCVLYPLFFPGEADRQLPILERYWVKANLWTFIFNFVGNYFWTHYFFVILGAKYTFPITWQLNKIPIPLFFVTQAYFLTYFAISTPILRKIWTSLKPGINRVVVCGIAVVVLSYIIAFMETFTIASVPYYTFTDRYAMYVIGSTFYGLYFVIAFPFFARVDENIGERWILSKTAIDSLAASMIVFILCDFWRLAMGGIGMHGVNLESVPFLVS